MSERRIQCPLCDGKGEHIDLGETICGLCDGRGTIPDRRRPTANDRAVERIKARLQQPGMTSVGPCDCLACEFASIIREEAERGD